MKIYWKVVSVKYGKNSFLLNRRKFDVYHGLHKVKYNLFG